MKPTVQIFIIFIILSLFSCKTEITDILIDNPSQEKIKIKIDGEEPQFIEAEQTIKVNLLSGKRSIQVNDLTPIDFTLDPAKKYLINPLLETYYIERRKYFISAKMEKRYFENKPYPKSIVEGIEVNRDFTKIENSLLIVNNWHVGINKQFKSRANVKKMPSKGYTTARKIYRKSEAINLVNNALNDVMPDEIKKMLEKMNNK